MTAKTQETGAWQFVNQRLHGVKSRFLAKHGALEATVYQMKKTY